MLEAEGSPLPMSATILPTSRRWSGSIWAAVIAVPTAVTGFYGQDVPYPGFGRLSGFWTSSMLTLALALFFVFGRKDWI